MDLFGEEWINHADRIAKNWQGKIREEDVVLLAGDFSWAKNRQEVLPDLEWLESLPGRKILIKGNHDFWWSSAKQMASFLPPSVTCLHNTAWNDGQLAIAGTRLWNSSVIPFEGRECSIGKEDENIFLRELGRLERSLLQMNEEANLRLVMTHYPPVNFSLESTVVTQMLRKHRIERAIFGHLHGLSPDRVLFGNKEGICYQLTSCDYLQFSPLFLFSF